MGGKAYRCDACRDQTSRCEVCRVRRAKANADRRDEHRAKGRCIQCKRKAKPGFTRCQHHLDLNAVHSLYSHAKATAERREAEGKAR